jgi:hypothetical protein
MDLIKSIRKERAQRDQKQPYRPTLFVRVVSIVRQYNLDSGFLRKLDDFRSIPPEKIVDACEWKSKKRLTLLLFPLATEEEYNLVRTVLSIADNPYMHYAQSPDEILWSGPLYHRNPSIEPARLECSHFEALLLADVAMEYMENLRTELETLLDQDDPGLDESSRIQGRSSVARAMRSNIERLITFVNLVESNRK